MAPSLLYAHATACVLLSLYSLNRISKVIEFTYTVHLNGKNLSTNSSWDFDGVVDTMDPYWFVPDKYFFPRSYLSRWCCDSLQELFKKVVKIKSRQHFQAKKTSATPKFCKRNFSRMLRFENMNILSTPAPIFWVPKILVRYVWGEKFPSGKNK